MNSIKILVCLVIVLFAFSAAAQIYKYTDDEGNARFTDDLNQVPTDQRDTAGSSVEIESDTDEEVAEEEPELDEETDEVAEDDDEATEEPDEDEAEFEEDGDDQDQTDEVVDEK